MELTYLQAGLYGSVCAAVVDQRRAEHHQRTTEDVAREASQRLAGSSPDCQVAGRKVIESRTQRHRETRTNVPTSICQPFPTTAVTALTTVYSFLREEMCLRCTPPARPPAAAVF